MSPELTNAIRIAVENMGRYFTSHNIIDFILSRIPFREAYEDELARLNPMEDRAHAVRELDKQIGIYLKQEAENQNSCLRISFVSYLDKKSLNVNMSTTRLIGYYKRENWNTDIESQIRR